jgi:hypothetical protein
VSLLVSGFHMMKNINTSVDVTTLVENSRCFNPASAYQERYLSGIRGHRKNKRLFPEKPLIRNRPIATNHCPMRRQLSEWQNRLK